MERAKTISKVVKLFFLVLLMAFFAPAFVACSEDDIPVTSLSFTQTQYIVAQGDDVQLRVNLMPLEATNKIVRFFTDAESDKHITVDPNTGLVKVKVIDDKTRYTAKVFVKSDYGNFSDTCFITIVGDVQALSAPENLQYDDQTSSLVWDAVVARDEFVTYSPKYELSITKDGEQQEPQILSKTNFKLTDSGRYEVTLKSVVTEDDFTTLYTDSEETDSYSFEILPQVSNVNVLNDKISATTTGRMDVSYRLDLFKTTKVQSGETIRGDIVDTSVFDVVRSNNEIYWTIPKTFESGTYEFEITTTGNSALKIFESRNMVPVAIEKLPVPANLSYRGEVLSWDKVSNASGYVVFVWSKASSSSSPVLLKTIEDGFVENNGRFSLDMLTQDVSANAYTLRIQTVGNSKEILSSSVQKIDMEKLDIVENLRVSGNYIFWSPVKNAANYFVYVNGRNPYVDDPSNIQYNRPQNVLPSGNNDLRLDCASMKFVADGEFSGAQNVNVVSVVARMSYQDEDGQDVVVESVEPATLEIHKIAKANLKNCFGDVGWDALDGALNYEIIISKGNEVICQEVLSNDVLTYSFNDNSYTEQAGEYIVKVRGLGNGRNIRDGDEIVIDSTNRQNHTFTKQSAPIITAFSSEGVLVWEPGEFALDTTHYEISVFDVEQQDVAQTFNLLETSYDLSNYLSDYVGYGRYQFYINAVNDVSSIKYLNSERSEVVVPYKLATPQNLKISNGQFVWDEATNIVGVMEDIVVYEILIDGKNRINIDNFSNNPRTCLPTSAQMGAGSTCAVRIKTCVRKNSANSSNKRVLPDSQTVYVLDSSYSDSELFTRLASPKSPIIDKDENSSTSQMLVGDTIPTTTNYRVLLTYYTESISMQVKFEDVSCNQNDPIWSMSVSTLFTTNLDAGKYRATVVALGGDNYINSPESKSGASLYKLKTPELYIQDGVLHWSQVSGEIDGITTKINNYIINYRNTNTNTTATRSIEGTSWDMKGVAAGEYGISVTAVGVGSAIVSSRESVESSYRKLGAIDSNSIKIFKSSLLDNDTNYNTITWDSVARAQYRIKVYQILTNDVLKYDEVLETNSFVFDDTFASNRYYITVQAVYRGDFINGDISNQVFVNRLSTVTGISVNGTSSVVEETSSGKRLVDKNYLLSWDKINGAAGYTVSIKREGGGSTELQTINDPNTTSMYLIDSTINRGALGNSDVGLLGLTVTAKIDGSDENLVQKNGTLTISSATSQVKNIYRNRAPTINISDGKIVWTNNNVYDNGYMLVFSPTVQQVETVYVPIEGGVYSYDMSSTELADISRTYDGRPIYYNLSVIAVGNPSFYIQSIPEVFSVAGSGAVNIGKLQSVEDINVVNGEVEWGICGGISENELTYTTVATNGNNTVNYEDIRPQTGSNFVTLPRGAFAGLDGSISFTVQAKGTKGFSGVESYVYVNSIVTARSTFNVTKLQTPTDVHVENGEIVWYRNTEHDYGSYHVSGYRIVCGENTYEVGREEDFFLSEHFELRSSVRVQICAIGTLVGGQQDYVSSDFTDGFYAEIRGRPVNLTVKDGVLTWEEDSSAIYKYSDYELEIVLDDGVTKLEPLRSLQNSNALSEVASQGHKFSSIRVRHYGTEDSRQILTTVYLNSAYSTPLLNVIKLDEINDVTITEDGVIAWGGDYAYDSSVAGIAIKVDDTEVRTTERQNIDINSEEINRKIDQNGFASLDITYRAYAPNNERIDASQPIYLFSESKTINAIKFAPINSCKLSNDGLQLLWNMDIRSAYNIANDKIVLVYKYSEYENDEIEEDGLDYVDIAQAKTKEINLSETEQISEGGLNYFSIPLWDLGYYNFDFYVVTTSSNVHSLRSAPRSMNHVLFNKFSSGNGSAENPFVIKSTLDAPTSQNPRNKHWIMSRTDALTKFGYIKTLTTCFFRLAEDINLTSPTGSTNEFVNNFSFSESFIKPFTGGIDGMETKIENGDVVQVIHKISNFEIYSGEPLFNTIEGGTNKDLIDPSIGPNSSNFFRQRGVLMNLDIEVSKFEYSVSIESENTLYLGIVAKQMTGGLIANCSIGLDQTKYPRGYVSNNDYGTQPIVFGTFVGKICGTEEYDSSSYEPVSDKNSYRNTTITNCTSNFGISLLKTADQSSRATRVAGIAGECYGANIYNCANNGLLAATQVAGITLKSTSQIAYQPINAQAFSEVTISSVVSGCTNNGVLNAYSINNLGKEDWSYSGGIVGEATNTFIVNCINSGNIVADTIESHLDISTTDDTKSTILVGGIVATQKAKQYPNQTDKFYGAIINCLNVGEIQFTSDKFARGTEIDSGPSYFSGILASVDSVNNKPKNSYYDSTKNPTTTRIIGVGNLISTEYSLDYSSLVSESYMSNGKMANEAEISFVLSSDITPTYTSTAACFYSTLYLQKSVFTFEDGNYPRISFVSAN